MTSTCQPARLLCRGLIVFGGALFVASAWAGDAPVLRIGQETYDAARFDALAQALQPPQRVAYSANDLPREVVDDYATSHLLAAQGRQHHLDRDPVVAARIRVQSDLILADAERRRIMAATPTDLARVRGYFDAHQGDFDEYHLRHILVAVPPHHASRNGVARSDAQALARAGELRQQLRQGADFSKLAAQVSDDETTAQEGGALSAMFGRYLADEFAPTVRALAPGDVSEPVKSQAGYHLIELEQRRVASFEAIRPVIEAQLRSEAIDETVARLKRQQPVQLDRSAPGTAARPESK